jgi:hypothetical protein
MSSKTPESPLQLARFVPDEARWIDLRGLLLTERCDVWCTSIPDDGFVVSSRDFPFAVLFGHPEADLVSSSASKARKSHDGEHQCDDWQLLAGPEVRDLVRLALPGWRSTRVALHRRTGEIGPPKSFQNLEIRLLPLGLRSACLSLAELPVSSRRELALDWVARRPASVALAGSSVVSICWAAFTTETLWDVAIETIEPFRRRGLAASCFLTLAAHMGERTLMPVWGATVDNPASLRLAAKLGFVIDGYLDGWSRSR